ncbi:MAG: hypothetical protein AB7F96_21625 [Beijerinckiaceae bacterium]
MADQAQHSYRIETAEDPMGAGYGCPCCSGDGGARGFVYEGETPLAVYFAEAGGMSNKPVVLIGIVIGKWEGDTKTADRDCFVFAVSKDAGKTEIVPTIPYLLAYPEFPALGTKVEPEVAPDHAGFARASAVLDAIIDGDYRFLHLRGDDAPRRSRFAADGAPPSQ